MSTNSTPQRQRRNAVEVGLFPTAESIAAAKLAQAQEREAVRQATGLEIDDDGHVLGALLANAIASACYGPRGEFRRKQ